MGQELSTAKYYEQVQAETPRATSPAPRGGRTEPQPPPPSGSHLELLTRRATPVIAVCLIAGAGMALWLNRQELSADARYAGERTNALNFMLWLGGSDKTMKDVVLEVQRQSAAEVQSQLGAPSALEGMDLSNTDWSTFSQSVNPGVAVGAGSGKKTGRNPSKR
ncbi:MAG: hypothetical protein U0836_01850 [Pirellulales bacterium]